jgi:hypothetical protein
MFRGRLGAKDKRAITFIKDGVDLVCLYWRKKGGVGPRPLFLITFNEQHRCFLNDCFVGIGVDSPVSFSFSGQDNLTPRNNEIIENIDLTFRN